MAKVLLTKRVDNDAPNPWYADFEQSIAKREGVEKVESYSWNTPQAPADPGEERSVVANDHIKRIAQEYFRLKTKIDRGFGKQMDMSTEQLIEKAGPLRKR